MVVEDYVSKDKDLSPATEAGPAPAPTLAKIRSKSWAASPPATNCLLHLESCDPQNGDLRCALTRSLYDRVYAYYDGPVHDGEAAKERAWGHVTCKAIDLQLLGALHIDLSHQRA